jgi:hypothetical protein
VRLGIHMRRVNMTDDELWHAISQNTGALSALLHRQLEMDDADPGVTHTRMKADLIHFANRFQREYRECVAELRRRYPLG